MGNIREPYADPHCTVCDIINIRLKFAYLNYSLNDMIFFLF